MPFKFHVNGQPLPTVAAVPVPVEGGTLGSVNIDQLWLINTHSGALTVTITDGQTSPPFQFMTAVSMAAAATLNLPLYGLRFQGGIKWSATALSATDLVIDGTLNTKVTSASHNFTANDVGKTVAVSAGTGFTVGNYTIVSTASNAATLNSAVGTLGSTGGTYTLPMVLGGMVGER